MEVRGQDTGGAGEAKRRFQEIKIENVRSDRERLQNAREARHGLSEQRSKILRQAREQAVQRQLGRSRIEDAPVEARPAKGGDAVELSPIARAESDVVSPARQERLDGLRKEVTEGRLLSQERLEKTARGILRGE